MDSLPPELMLLIFKCLDRPAPSEMRLHDQPSHDMLEARSHPSSCPLKMISLVSRHWRTLVLPQLFRHILWRPNLSSLRAFTLNPIPLLRFLEENRLDRPVLTFTLLVDFHDKEAEQRRQTPVIRPVDLEWLWDQLLSVLDPLRFTIIARPMTLASFMSRMLFLDDAWQFDIPYHILSVARTTRGHTGTVAPDQYREVHGSRLRLSTTEVIGPSIAEVGAGGPTLSSTARTSQSFRHKKAPPCPLFTLRPWTSILLNEGSFTKVYRTQEFFQRRPPSMLGALLGCEEYRNDTALIPSTVIDFNYIAIFPLSTHVDTLLQNLPKLGRLFMQITPKPDNTILDNQEEMKHIEPSDLWMERNQAYSYIMRELTWVPTSRGHWGALRVFESGDAADKETWDVAVNFLERANIQGWKAERKGCLVRHIENEEDPDMNTQINGHCGGAANALEPSFLWVYPLSLPLERRSPSDQSIAEHFWDSLVKVNPGYHQILYTLQAERFHRYADYFNRLARETSLTLDFWAQEVKRRGRIERIAKNMLETMTASDNGGSFEVGDDDDSNAELIREAEELIRRSKEVNRTAGEDEVTELPMDYTDPKYPV